MHAEARAHGNGVPQAAGWLCGRDAHAGVTGAPVHLGALARCVAQSADGRIDPGKGMGSRPFGDQWPEHEPSGVIPGQEAVVLQGHGKAVRRGPRQPRGTDEIGK